MTTVTRYTLSDPVYYNDRDFVIPAGQVLVKAADYDELQQERDQLRQAAQQAAEVMEQAAGAPGEDWLEWQLKLADTLAALEQVGIRPTDTQGGNPA